MYFNIILICFVPSKYFVLFNYRSIIIMVNHMGAKITPFSINYSLYFIIVINILNCFHILAYNYYFHIDYYFLINYPSPFFNTYLYNLIMVKNHEPWIIIINYYLTMYLYSYHPSS